MPRYTRYAVQPDPTHVTTVRTPAARLPTALTCYGMAAAVRYATIAGPHRVRRNALSRMVGAAQNLDSPTHAHLHARRMLFAYWS
jgi:hypothetical protein